MNDPQSGGDWSIGLLEVLAVGDCVVRILPAASSIIVDDVLA